MKITIKGETKSLAEWSIISRLTEATILKRMKQGLTGEDLIAPPFSSVRTKVSYHDKTYTFSELSKETGVPVYTLRARYANGEREDELVRPVAIRPVLIFGESLLLEEVAEKYNEDISVLKERYNQGYRGEDIVYPPEPDYEDTVRELWHGHWYYVGGN